MYRVPKKVPEYRYPLYRSTGIRFLKKVISDLFLEWFKKVILEHTTRTFRILFAPFHREVFLFAPFHRGTEITNQNKTLTAFTHIVTIHTKFKYLVHEHVQLHSAWYVLEY